LESARELPSPSGGRLYQRFTANLEPAPPGGGGEYGPGSHLRDVWKRIRWANVARAAFVLVAAAVLIGDVPDLGRDRAQPPALGLPDAVLHPPPAPPRESRRRHPHPRPAKLTRPRRQRKRSARRVRRQPPPVAPHAPPPVAPRPTPPPPAAGEFGP